MISRSPHKNRAPQWAAKYFGRRALLSPPDESSPSRGFSSSAGIGTTAAHRRAQESRQSTLARRSGFSLLEVTIALVIFVVGALAIVRIFPGALGVVQTSENRGVGARLAQTTLSRYENDPLSAPYSTYDLDNTLFDTTKNPYSWSDFNGAVAGTRNNGFSLPSAPSTKDDTLPANYYQSPIGQSALGRFRYIVGEGHIVPDSSRTNIVLTRFPYQENTLSLYRELDVDGVRVESSGELNFTDASIQTVNGRADFNAAPTYPRRPKADYPDSVGTVLRSKFRFYVSYRWRDTGTNRVSGVNDELKSFPDEATWTAGSTTEAQVLHSFVSTHKVVEGSVRVKVRIPLTMPPLPAGAFPQENDKAARGVGLYNFPAPPVLSPGERISFDYMVRDWRWITVDGAASNPVSPPTDDSGAAIAPPGGNPPTPRQLELPVRYVTTENPNTNQYPFYSLLIGKREDGFPAPAGFGEWSPESFGTTNSINRGPNYFNLWKVEPKSGRVVFNVGRGGVTPINPSTTETRSVYRTVDGWGHQVSVAAKNYTPFVSEADVSLAARKNSPREPWREYFFKPADFMATTKNATENNTLYFHPADAGHSLMVSFEYRESAGGNYRTVVNQLVTLDSKIESRPSIMGSTADTFFGASRTSSDPPTATTGIVAGRLNDLSGNPIGDSTNPAYITAITAVKGVSIRARSAWVDGDRYSQTGVVGYRKNTD